jgi:tetratricopeptide (TPR) repeat protein
MSDQTFHPPTSPATRGAGLIPSFVIIAAMTLLAFLPSINNGFTNWDDNKYVTENPDLAVHGSHGLIKIATSNYVGNFHPLTMLAYMAEYRLFHLNPAGYHGVNLLLHLFNALLVCACIGGLSGSSAAALAGGLLFAIHPLRVESVAWVAELKDVLCGLFYFLSILLYLRYSASGKRATYGACFVAFVMALLAKPMAVSLPIALLLIDYLKCRPCARRCVGEKIPFIALAALFCVVTFGAQSDIGALNERAMLPRLFRLCIPFYAMIFYPIKTVAPLHLSVLYIFPDTPGLPLTLMIELLLSPVIVFTAGMLLWRYRGSDRTVVFGAAFFLATILPVLQIVSPGLAVVADRYSYIPSLGLCLLFGQGIAALEQRTAEDRLQRFIPVILTAALAAGLSVVTFNRCMVWRDGVTLWSDCLATAKNPVAFHNRGCAYVIEGKPDSAIADYTAAIALSPSYASAWYNRGSVFLSQNDFARAAADLTEAIRLSQKYADACNNRGIAFLEEKRYGEAIADFRRVIELKPDFASAYYNRGLTLLRMGKFIDAATDFSRTIDLNPGFIKAYQGRAECMKALARKPQ